MLPLRSWSLNVVRSKSRNGLPPGLSVVVARRAVRVICGSQSGAKVLLPAWIPLATPISEPGRLKTG
jgi:hypothetical protein